MALKNCYYTCIHYNYIRVWPLKAAYIKALSPSYDTNVIRERNVIRETNNTLK